MDLHFVWQAWHLRHAAGRGTYGTQLGLVTRLVGVDAVSFCVAGVALGDIDLYFVWQAWRLTTWTFTLCGRRGTYGTQLGLVTRLVGVDAARGTYGTQLGLVTRLVGVDAASFCVAGVALGDIDLHFVWQAWNLTTWTFTLCGRRSTYGTQQGLVTRLVGVGAASFCVAGVALGDIDLYFVWQAWRLTTWTFTLCGRRGTYGTQLGLVTRLVGVDAASFCVAGVALGEIDLYFVWQAWHLRHSAGSGDALGFTFGHVF
eukprot:s2974_g16.t1